MLARRRRAAMLKRRAMNSPSEASGQQRSAASSQARGERGPRLRQRLGYRKAVLQAALQRLERYENFLASREASGGGEAAASKTRRAQRQPTFAATESFYNTAAIASEPTEGREGSSQGADTDSNTASGKKAGVASGDSSGRRKKSR